VEPLVLAGRSDAMRWTALETIRTWRFEPARREGKPVAVLLDIQLPPRTETLLAEMMPFTGELGSIHVLIQRQEWENARTRAVAAVQSVAEESLADPRRQAAALALLALADAGSGGASAICYWHAAQALYGDLYHAELDAYGAAGALLEASNPWVLDEKALRVGASLEEETILRPEKIKGGPFPQYSEKERRAGAQGTIIMDVAIGEDGRVSQPRLLKGLAPATDLLALPAICEWRFNPATAGGKPVKVYYTLTVNYAVYPGS
jgi:TonB family protein